MNDDDHDVLKRLELEMLHHQGDVTAEKLRLVEEAERMGGWWCAEWENVCEAVDALKTFPPEKWW